MGSAATHAVLPRLATQAGRRLQVDAGLRSRRFGPGRLLAAGVRVLNRPRCAARRAGPRLHLPRPKRPRGRDGRSQPDPLRGGPVAFTIDWPTVRPRLVRGRLPRRSPLPRVSPALGEWDPALVDRRPSVRRPPRRGGPPSTPRRSSPRSATASTCRQERGRRGLCVFAIDTELLGHWWAEGPIWLREVLRGAEHDRVRLLTLSRPRRARTGFAPRGSRAGARGRASRPGLPAVADMVWATRRSSCGCLRRGATEREPRRPAPRASCSPVERLGVHGSPRPRPAITHARATAHARPC